MRRAASACAVGHRGFTLIEAMVVVALIAIVLAIAAPGFGSLIAAMNAKSAAFDLVGDLAMARSESLKRNVNVSVVPVNGSWLNGWQVSASNEATPLRERRSLPPNLSFAAPTEGVVFLPSGRLSGADGNASWSISSSVEGVTPRCIVLTPTGTARSKPGACS